MVLNKSDKEYLLNALNTEIARVKRAGNAQCAPAIKDILGHQLAELQMLIGRVSQEVVK